ncbi:MAG: YihY/virulence factor BrkB family protein [Anaerolineae bacterium]
MDRIHNALSSAQEWANEVSGGRWAILQDAAGRFNSTQGPDAAAALAYYALFSLFPLLLALVAVASFFLTSEEALQQVVNVVARVVPVSEHLIESNIRQVLERRGSISIAGAVGLLWSGMGAFTVLVHQINRAWTDVEPRGFFTSRLLALGLAGLLAVLLLLSFTLGPALSILARLRVPLWGGVALYNTFLWGLLINGLPLLLIFAIFMMLYRWAPNTKVPWGEAFWGALFVALTWEAVKRGLTWYISSDLVNYPLVYGSLSSVVALLLWIYVSSYLSLFGAHLSAAVGRGTVRKPHFSGTKKRGYNGRKRR